MAIKSTSKLRCAIQDNSLNLFFSLADYRNNIFTSSDLNRIIEFYDGFKNRDQLIEWMNESPKGGSYIHEVEGYKDIIAAVPTADFNGNYAVNFRKKILKSLHMAFVESGGRGSLYFNYAQNYNVGIKRTMESNPKLVVVSKVNVYKVDIADVKKNKISKIDSKNIMMISSCHSPCRSYWKVIGIKRGKIFIFTILIYYFTNKKIKEYEIDSIEILMLRKKLNYQVEKFVGDA